METEKEYYVTWISFNHRDTLCRALNPCIERDIQNVMDEKGFHERVRL